MRASLHALLTVPQRIVSELKIAKAESEGLCQKIETLEYHELNYQRDLSKLRNEQKARQQTLDSAPFVLLLIDGDSTLFNDAYVKAGAEGGHRAVHALKAELESYLRDKAGCQPHWKIVVRIYVKMNSLTTAYADSGIVSDARTAKDFFRGLNEVHPLFEIIDAGQDKEGADTKVKGKIHIQ